jgi:hypothetical protein
MAALLAETPVGNHQELGFPSDETTQGLKQLFVRGLASLSAPSKRPRTRKTWPGRYCGCCPLWWPCCPLTRCAAT